MVSLSEGIFAAVLAFLITVGVAFLNCIVGAVIGYLMSFTPINDMVLGITKEIFPNSTLVDWGVFLGFLSSLFTLGSSGSGSRTARAEPKDTKDEQKKD